MLNKILIKLRRIIKKNSFENIKLCFQALIMHPAIFLKYKNIYKDKEIVIVGCGPTTKYFEPLNDKIYIGINRAYKLKNIKLNFLFAQDWLDEDDMIEANNYNKNYCKKFYGILSDSVSKKVFPRIKKIPKYHRIDANSYNYILNNYTAKNFEIDIAKKPISDLHGTVFSAMQFALYTNPKTIYLVGCDCTTGHFHKEQKNNPNADLSSHSHIWKQLKQHSEKYNPNTKIISINPVGLKGLFEDIYTQSYIKNNPEKTI